MVELINCLDKLNYASTHMVSDWWISYTSKHWWISWRFYH